MSIPLNDILKITDEEISRKLENGATKYKILLNTNHGAGGESFINRWLKCNEDKRRSGDSEAAPYWVGGNSRRHLREGQWAFSFAKLNLKEWLFISAVEIEEALGEHHAKVKVLDKYKPYFGRLIIEIPEKKGNGYCFNLERYLSSATVKEILPAIYNNEIFPGYDQVHLDYKDLQRVFNQEIPTYYDALKSVTGVYCLTDIKTGKLYIGSATGKGGVADRWGSYLKSKHGNNKELVELYEAEGSKYFEDNFKFTLLEYFGMSYDERKVKKREQWWMKVLDTIDHGYNSRLA